MGSLGKRRWFVLTAMLVFSFGFYNFTEAQGLLTATPPSRVSNSITGPSDIIPFSSGMLGDYMPTIPNLQFGFQYFFGDKVRSGQLNADYLLPYKLGASSVLFGEAHGNYWNFGRQPTNGASNRVDISLGGGYRSILADKLLVGINGFYDTSRLFNNWYSSGGAGLEMAANVGTSDAFDLNANWYGDIFSSTDIINAFRNQGSSYDVEAGYSHALFDSQYDLRLKLAGYQFNTGTNVYGYKTGADLTTKNGMFTLRYEYGNDKLNGPWNNVGAFVNIGFQMENLIKGESPFTMPEPIFRSPRNLRRMLTQTVKRDWNQQYAPGRASLAAAASSGGGVTRTLNFYTTVSHGWWVDLSPVVMYSDVCQFNTLTISFQNAPSPLMRNIYMQLSYNPGPGKTSYVPIPITQTSTITKVDYPEVFGGGSCSPDYNFYELYLGSAMFDWVPGNVTLTWQ